MWKVWTSVSKKTHFWANKLSFMFQFAHMCRWDLVWDEWKMTQKEWEDAEKRIDEICAAAAKRVLAVLEQEKKNE